MLVGLPLSILLELLNFSFLVFPMIGFTLVFLFQLLYLEQLSSFHDTKVWGWDTSEKTEVVVRRVYNRDLDRLLKMGIERGRGHNQ